MTAILATIFIFFLANILKRFITTHIKDNALRYRIRKTIAFIGFILTILVLANIFSDRIGRVTVVLGVAGAGIAFALQEVIASIAGWVAISFGSFYKTGDRVQLGGIKGDIIDIGILRTTLMECGEWVKSDLYSGRIVRIANSFVFKEPVFNYSGDFPFLWDEITVPVKYGSDYESARKILLAITEETVSDYTSFAKESWKELVSKYKIEDAKIDPAVTLSLNDNWIEFSIRYVIEYKRRRFTKDLIFTRILNEFAKTNGAVAIASTTLHLVETPVIDVRLHEQKKEGIH